MKLWAKRIVLALLIGEGVWVLTSALFLNVGGLESVINTNPQSVEIGYGFAFSPYPGKVRVSDLHLRIQDTNVQIYFELKKVWVSVRMDALFRREFWATRVDGEGLAFYLRLRRNEAEATPMVVATLPPIPGLAVAPKGKETPDDDETWKVRITGVKVKAEDLWFEDYRYQGPLAVNGGFYLWTGGKALEVFPSTVRFDGGSLALGPHSFASGIRGPIQASIAPMVPDQVEGKQFFRSVSAESEVVADIETLQFLNHYLRKIDWLRFETGKGHIQARVAVDHGRVQRGRLNIQGRKMAVKVVQTRIEGEGDILFRAQSRKSGLTVQLRTYRVRPLTARAAGPRVRGERLTARLTSGPIDLAGPPPEMDFELKLPAAEFSNAALFNGAIPPSAGLKFLSGRGNLNAYFSASTDPERSGSGVMKVDFKRTELEVKRNRKWVDLKVVARVQNLNLDRGGFDLSGSTAEVRILDNDTHLAAADDWVARLLLTDAWVQTGPQSYFTGGVDIAASDARPFVQVLLASDKSAPPTLVENLLAFDNLQGRTRIYLDGEQLSITGSELNAYSNRLVGWYQEKNGKTSGRWLLHLDPFAVGLAMQDDGLRLRLQDADNWFVGEPRLLHFPERLGSSIVVAE